MRKGSRFSEKQLEKVREARRDKNNIQKMMNSEYQKKRKEKKQKQIEEYNKNPNICKCGCGEVVPLNIEKGIRVLNYIKGHKQVSSFKGKTHSKESRKKMSESSKGKDIWNKGKTKETEPGLMRISKYMTENNPNFNSEVIKRTAKTKNMTGNFGGTCKWHQYHGQRLQGNFELKFAKFLDSIDIKWISHGDIEVFEYIGLDNKKHIYNPDFRDENGIYYDPHAKYYWDEEFEYKINEVRKNNPGTEFVVFHEENYLETCQQIIENKKLNS